MKVFVYLALISVVFILTAHAQLYKWTDENGVTHWTDTPPVNMKGVEEEVEIKITTVVSAPEKTSQETYPERLSPNKSKETREQDSNKSAQYNRTYRALQKLSSGLNTGVGWELYYELLGEAGFEIDQLKRAHTDWEQKNKRFEKRFQELEKAYFCYDDASTLWRSCRQNDREMGIAGLKRIGPKYSLKREEYTIVDSTTILSDTFDWEKAARRVEKILYSRADKHIENYLDLKE